MLLKYLIINFIDFNFLIDLVTIPSNCGEKIAELLQKSILIKVYNQNNEYE